MLYFKSVLKMLKTLHSTISNKLVQCSLSSGTTIKGKCTIWTWWTEDDIFEAKQVFNWAQHLIPYWGQNGQSNQQVKIDGPWLHAICSMPQTDKQTDRQTRYGWRMTDDEQIWISCILVIQPSRDTKAYGHSRVLSTTFSMNAWQLLKKKHLMDDKWTTVEK